MQIRSILSEISFFQPFPDSFLDQIAEQVMEHGFSEKEIVVRRYDEARFVYFLLDGHLRYSLDIDNVQDLLVGETHRFGTLIGWSAFRAPYRYNTKVSCETNSLLLQIPVTVFIEAIENDPQLGALIYQQVVFEIIEKYRDARNYLLGGGPYLQPARSELTSTTDSVETVPAETILDYLKDSFFFETLTDEELQQLAQQAQQRVCAPNEKLFTEGQPTENLYMLVQGKIRLSYFREEVENTDISTSQRKAVEIPIRTISESGQVIGWMGLLSNSKHDVSTTILEPSLLFYWPKSFFEACFENVDLKKRLMERCVWKVGGRLRSTRIHLIAQRYQEETLAIRALLKQNAAQLNVTSPLHKIPYFLENQLTVSDAFHCLDLLHSSGTKLERSLAGQCLDILTLVRKELKVFQHSQNVYDIVSNAPQGMSQLEIRQACCREYIHLFHNCDYILKGEEHLPKETGNIFIMNHLTNDLINMLPNDFLLTLDSHFVSSMIIYRNYGDDGGVRVVRKSSTNEFGHQRYYDRLEYMYVYAGHITPPPNVDPEQWVQEQRTQFKNLLEENIRARKNLIICPEGNSYDTEESPKPFKGGIFRQATFLEPEPTFVPVAVAYFDKNIIRTPPVAVIHPPFKLSEVMNDPQNKEELSKFIDDLNEKFKGYVEEARQLSGPIQPKIP